MNHDPAIVAFVAGVLTAGFLAVGVYFIKFWRRTKDGLFLAFAAAFSLMALNQAVPVLVEIRSENASFAYFLRLAAFLLIIWAILRKNLRRN